MASSTTHFLNPLSMPDSCNFSHPSLLASIHRPQNPSFSLLAKSFKLSYALLSSPLSLKPKIHQSSFVALVAQTSDWAQQEEDSTLTVAEQEEPAWTAEGLNVETEAGQGEEEEGESQDGNFVEPPEEAKIYVGNLPFDVDSQGLATLFEKAGTVEIAEVIYNRETDRSRGFGFVTMSTVEEADKAVEMFHRYDLDGRYLTVNKAAPRGSRVERPPRAFESSAFRIYVGNLPWDMDNSRLEQIFSEHGKVVDARVVYDRETGRSRGFAFVTMSSEAELNDAIAALDGQSIDGRSIRVNVAAERPPRRF